MTARLARLVPQDRRGQQARLALRVFKVSLVQQGPLGQQEVWDRLVLALRDLQVLQAFLARQDPQGRKVFRVQLALLVLQAL